MQERVIGQLWRRLRSALPSLPSAPGRLPLVNSTGVLA
jgi:hypothetical protein